MVRLLYRYIHSGIYLHDFWMVAVLWLPRRSRAAKEPYRARRRRRRRRWGRRRVCPGGGERTGSRQLTRVSERGPRLSRYTFLRFPTLLNRDGVLSPHRDRGEVTHPEKGREEKQRIVDAPWFYARENPKPFFLFIKILNTLQFVR